MFPNNNIVPFYLPLSMILMKYIPRHSHSTLTPCQFYADIVEYLRVGNYKPSYCMVSFTCEIQCMNKLKNKVKGNRGSREEGIMKGCKDVLCTCHCEGNR